MITLTKQNETKTIDDKSSLLPLLKEQGWLEEALTDGQVKDAIPTKAETKKKEVKDAIPSATGN